MIPKKSPAKLVVILITLLVISVFGFSKTSRSAAQYFFGFFTKPFFNLSSYLSDRFSSKQDLLQENKDLYKQLEEITIDYAYLKDIESENKILKKELDYLKTVNYQYKVADVLAGTSFPGLDILVLNKGESNGVKEGMPVIYGEGLLIGKIYKSEKFTSQMVLINNNNSSLSAQVQNDQLTPGVVNGKHNLALVLEFVPQDQEISVGQTVVTSGRENFIPPGLVIGKISSINKIDNDFFQSATLNSAVKLDNFRQVIILVQDGE